MKTLLSLLFFICSQYSFGPKGADCGLLKCMLKEPYEKVFKLQFLANRNLPIIIVDTARFFEACNIELEEGKVLRIVHEATYLDKRNDEIFVVYVTPKRNQNYQIDLYSRSSHGICSADVQERKGKIYWTKIRCGTLD